MQAPSRKLAVGIVSGGLDSLLAVRLVQRMDIDVLALHFVIGFEPNHLCGLVDRPGQAFQPSSPLVATGARVEVIDLRAEFMPILADPPCGYGSCCNPCIDCHALMLQKAGLRMRALGAAFVFSGEVLGQRPMSQNLQSLGRVAQRSGLGDRLVRPLSGALLPPSAPEREGIFRREQLLALSGRSRRPQKALALELGVHEYPAPAGGCLLTDPQFSRRLQDLFARRPGRVLELDDPLLLFAGRHIVLPGGSKLVIAREDRENAVVARFARLGLLLEAEGVSGPLALLEGQPAEDDLVAAARWTARHGKGRGLARVQVRVTAPDGASHLLEVAPGEPEGSRVL